MTRTKFLIRDLKTFDGQELETQQDANIFFLENLIKQEQQIQDILDGGLDDDFVKTSGDIMTGPLRIKDEDGHILNIGERYEASINNQSGLVTITKDDQIKFESYYDNVQEEYIIDVNDPAIPNPLNAISISGSEVTIGRNLNVLGSLFAGGIDIIAELNKQIDGNFGTKIDRKYDKTGGPITGPMVVIPAGAGTDAVFEVNSGGVWCYIEPTHPYHVATKGYVDRTKMPYDITNLRRLNTVQSFLG